MAFKTTPPARNRSETAAMRTHDSAKAIIDAETAARHANIKRLKAARLEQEALIALEPKPAPPVKRSRAKKPEPS
jgi:hypothetical protein